MSNRTFLKLCSLLAFAFIFGCGIKTKLSKEELKWMDVYKEGDTLIFKSDKGEYDTTTIIKREISYPEYNPVEVHGKYLPQWGELWYKNKNLEYHADGYRLVTLIKKHPRNETYLNINYLYGSIIFNHCCPTKNNIKSSTPFIC